MDWLGRLWRSVVWRNVCGGDVCGGFVACVFVSLLSLVAESWSSHCIKTLPSGSSRIRESHPICVLQSLSVRVLLNIVSTSQTSRLVTCLVPSLPLRPAFPHFVSSPEVFPSGRSLLSHTRTFPSTVTILYGHTSQYITQHPSGISRHSVRIEARVSTKVPSPQFCAHF